MVRDTPALGSLYTSGQCLLSVLGSVGVILLFAGIPQLIYATHINPGSLLTFLLGALLITLMVTGNAFIGYKYRQLINQERSMQFGSSLRRPNDKPPSYDDLVKQDGSPPSYAKAVEKPPRYEDYINEVFNWDVETGIRCNERDSTCQSNAIPEETNLTTVLPAFIPLHERVTRLQLPPEQSSSRSNSPRGVTNQSFDNRLENIAEEEQTSPEILSLPGTTEITVDEHVSLDGLESVSSES